MLSACLVDVLQTLVQKKGSISLSLSTKYCSRFGIFQKNKFTVNIHVFIYNIVFRIWDIFVKRIFFFEIIIKTIN